MIYKKKNPICIPHTIYSHFFVYYRCIYSLYISVINIYILFMLYHTCVYIYIYIFICIVFIYYPVLTTTRHRRCQVQQDTLLGALSGILVMLLLAQRLPSSYAESEISPTGPRQTKSHVTAPPRMSKILLWVLPV